MENKPKELDIRVPTQNQLLEQIKKLKKINYFKKKIKNNNNKLKKKYVYLYFCFIYFYYSTNC